jgi:DNA topoisomerase I
LRTTNVLDAINESLGHHIFPDRGDGIDPRACQSCGTGRLSLKTSKFGAFIGCTNYPDCKYTRQLGSAASGEEASGDRVLGTDPETGLEIHLKIGRFGPYVQLGEGEKPKRSSLPKGWQASEMDLAAGLKLLALPRTVGTHPGDGEIITANLGRYGPYIQHGKTFANVPSIEDVFEIGINRAVTVLAEKKAGIGRPGRGAATPPIKEFAPAQEGEPTIRVMSGRFGPYVTDGTTNATITKGIDPASVTLEIAKDLIAARVAIVGVGKKKPARKAPSTTKKAATTKASTKKPTTKKPTAKKPTAKKPSTKTKASA